VKVDRGRDVYAAPTMILAWGEAGRPISSCKAVASCGPWSDPCRQPLLWLGQSDPALAVFDGMAEDPDRETLGRLLVVWHGQFGASATMVGHVVQRTEDSRLDVEDLRDAVADSGKRFLINRRSFGCWPRGGLHPAEGLRSGTLLTRWDEACWDHLCLVDGDIRDIGKRCQAFTRPRLGHRRL
jgi:hypothetical protein